MWWGSPFGEQQGSAEAAYRRPEAGQELEKAAIGTHPARSMIQ